MQTKEIKLNISYISYIVLGLLAFILLFVGFTAHAQNENRIYLDSDTKGRLIIGEQVPGATAHLCVVYDYDASALAGEAVIPEALNRAVAIIEAQEGTCPISPEAYGLKVGRYFWLAYAVVDNVPTHFSKKISVLEIKAKQSFLRRIFSAIGSFFKGEAPLPEPKIVTDACCQIIQDEINELSDADDIAALETTLGILCPPPLPPITFPPIRVPVIGDIGFPGIADCATLQQELIDLYDDLAAATNPQVFIDTLIEVFETWLVFAASDCDDSDGIIGEIKDYLNGLGITLDDFINLPADEQGNIIITLCGLVDFLDCSGILGIGGVVITTTTDTSGNVTTTYTYPNGVVVIVVTDTDGNVISTTWDLSGAGIIFSCDNIDSLAELNSVLVGCNLPYSCAGAVVIIGVGGGVQLPGEGEAVTMTQSTTGVTGSGTGINFSCDGIDSLEELSYVLDQCGLSYTCQ